MQSSLIFLPDISGFTNFVHSTAAEHSQHIIAELLESIIDSQELDLTLSDIEGDALFYYKDKSVPTPEQLFAQVKKMYVNFHNHLKLYETNRICQCGACSSASKLTLKFFAHAGLLEFINIKNDRKPYGKDVIQAHRLMKNNVPIDDYLLISEGLWQSWKDRDIQIPKELQAIDSQYEYDLGMVKFKYFDLTPLKKYTTPPPPMEEIPDSGFKIKASDNIDLPAEELFELVSNLNHRLEWNKELDDLQYNKNEINRVGTKHLCVIQNRTIEFETVTKDMGPKKLVYGERTKDLPIIKEMVTYMIIEQEEGKTKFTLEAHPQNPNFFQRLILSFFKSYINKSIKSTILNIKTAAESFKKRKNAPVEV